MKIKRSNSSSRRASPLTVVIMIALLIVAALLALGWSRGGEQPQHRVEKVIPAERLGR